MKINLGDAINLIESATAVVVDSNVLVYPRIEDDEAESIFMELENDDIHEKFNAKDNAMVELTGSSLTLVNTRGEPTHILLLAPMGVDANKPV